MANSKSFLGDINIRSFKLGTRDVKLYLGDNVVYPLEKSIGDAVVSCDDATYNGSIQTAQNIVVTLNGATLVAGTDYTVTSNTGGTNAGTYPIVITGAGEYTGTTSGMFTINKATGSVTTAPINNDYTYNGTNRAVASNGGGTGTMYYRLGTSGSFSTIMPTMTDAGSNTLYYYAAESTNYTQSPTSSITVSVQKASQNAPTATGATTTYDTTATATASGGGGQGSIEWSNGNTQTSVGSKTTKARWSGNGNYNASPYSNEVTLTMNKAAGSVSTAPVNNNYAYNGTARAVASAGSGTGTMYYRLGTSGSFSTTMPTMTDAGSNTLYYYAAESTNYTQSSTGSITVSVQKADQAAPTATGATTTYNTTATATASGGGGQGSIEWESAQSQTSVGSHTTRARWSGNSNYNASPWSSSVTVQMNKAPGSVTTVPVNTNYTYNGTARAVASAGSGTGTMYYRLGTSGSFSTTMPTMTNAGSNTLYYYAAASTNYEQSSTGNITVSVQKADGTATVNGVSTTYNGSAIALDTVNNNTGTMHYSTNGTTWSTSIPTATNAGSYTVYWYMDESTNYNGIASASSRYVSSTITCYSATAPTAKNPNWTGSAQALANAGSTSYGTMVYCSTSGGTFTTAIPTGTNAGSYEVWWKVTGNTNVCNTAATKVACTIKQVAMTYTAPSAATRTYTGSAQQIVSGGSANGGNIYYATSSAGASSSTTVPTQTNAGTYSTYWKAVPDSNHSGGTSSWAQVSNCVINKVPMTYTAPSATTYTYGNTARALMSGGTASGGSIKYSTSQSGAYTTTVPTQTNAGTYTTWWKAEPDSNHSGGTNAVSVSTTISKANISPTVSISNWTYGGTASNPSVAGNSGSGTVTYYYKLSSASSWSTTKPSDAGSYNIRADIAATTNYNSGTCTSNFTINKAAGSVSTAPANNGATYGSGSYLCTTGSGTGTMMYKLGSGSYSTSRPTTSGLNAGSYTLYYKASASTNYNESSQSSITVTVQKANISPTVSISNWTYGGTASSPSVAGNTGGGTVTYYYKLSSASSWSTTRPSNAGSYNIRADIAATTNYNSGTCTNNFTINKANSSLSFSVTNIKVKVGETNTNVVTVNAGDGTVTYSSNNTSIVTVNNSGVVTGVSTGNTTVSANISSTNNYNSATTSYSASCVLPIIITAKFNVTSTINTTKIADNTSSFTRIEIDGVIQPSVTSGYTFSTTGEHTVKYYLDDTRIGNRAFTNCSGLTSIDIPDEVTSIGDTAFGGCGLKRINSNTNGVFNIPNGVTSIGTFVFSECNGLVNVNIHNRLTVIGNGAFSACANLTSVIIPDSVETINNYAFSSCTSLTSCTINGYVSSYAFERCSSLRTVTLGAGTTTLNSYVFYLCNGISSITSLAMTAPTTKSDTFRNMSERGTLYIPTGSSGYNTWKSKLGTNWTIVEQ